MAMSAQLPSEKQPISLRQRVEIARRVGSNVSLTPEQALSLIEAAEDVARYENSRRIQAAENDRLRNELMRVEAERDQYKQVAEINANTIKCMQAAVNLHAAEVRS